MNIALQDKVIKKYMDDNRIDQFMDCSNEGEAVAIAAGYFLATGQRANVYFSADGLCNAMNFITSWIIPEGIEMNLFISTGRTELPHIVMTEIYDDLLKLLPTNPEKLSITTIRK